MKIRQENKNIIFHSEKKYQIYKEQDTHPLFEGSGQWSIEDNDRFVYRIEEDGNTRYYANPLLENTHILKFSRYWGDMKPKIINRYDITAFIEVGQLSAMKKGFPI